MIAGKLGAYAVDLRTRPLSDDVLHAAKRCFLDGMAAMICGAVDPRYGRTVHAFLLPRCVASLPNSKEQICTVWMADRVRIVLKHRQSDVVEYEWPFSCRADAMYHEPIAYPAVQSAAARK